MVDWETPTLSPTIPCRIASAPNHGSRPCHHKMVLLCHSSIEIAHPQPITATTWSFEMSKKNTLICQRHQNHLVHFARNSSEAGQTEFSPSQHLSMLRQPPAWRSPSHSSFSRIHQNFPAELPPARNAFEHADTSGDQGRNAEPGSRTLPRWVPKTKNSIALTCIVPTSSELSSGLVPIKSYDKHRVHNDSACSSIAASCAGLALTICLI